MCGARSSDTRFPLKGTPPSVLCPCRCAAPFGSRGPIKPRASYAAGRARRSWSVCQNSLSPCGRVPWDLAVCAVGGWVLSNPGFHGDSPPPFLGLGARVGLRPSTPASWYTQRGVVPAPPWGLLFGLSFGFNLVFVLSTFQYLSGLFGQVCLPGQVDRGGSDFQSNQAVQ